MILVVGLGNPGKKFEKTRHNVGFRVVDGFQEKNNFPAFKLSKKFLAEISEGALGDAKVILAKPQTFMNNSGRAVKLLNSKSRIQNSELFIIHDDIDLPLGKIRISVGRSSAGHKGVESIIRELKTKGFVRFRVGIKPEKVENRKQKTEKSEHISYVLDRAQNNFVRGFVLQKFSKDEEKILGGVIKEAVEAIKMAIKEGTEKTMGRYNQ